MDSSTIPGEPYRPRPYAGSPRSPRSPTLSPFSAFQSRSTDEIVQIDDDEDEQNEFSRLIEADNIDEIQGANDEPPSPLIESSSNSTTYPIITTINRRQKTHLLKTLTHLLAIEMIYCYYLDNNVALLLLRGLQLFAFLKGGVVAYRSHIALIVFTSNIPVLITHIIYTRRNSFLLNFIAEEEPTSLPLVLSVDFLILIFQILLINSKYELEHTTSPSQTQNTQTQEQEEEEEHEDYDSGFEEPNNPGVIPLIERARTMQ
ncbi:hypothetical protein AKO1_015274 [Acrasis kona]|uniref:DUF1746 domain-containing protein n=1 Tax=Acrasis kona TaxID=1008807 RepID=A0AAW2ZFI0_9EUKA